MTGPTPRRSRRLSRRSLLAGSAAATATALSAAPQAAAAPRPKQDRNEATKDRTVVHLLGTAGGPPPYGERMGIASAVTVGGDTYLVDCGRGAVTQYLRAGLSMPSLKGIFLTHLHADHIVDYFDFPLLCAGVMPPQPGLGGTVRVWGPGPSDTVASGPVSPERPAPGIAETTRRANATFAASTNAFIAEGFGVDPVSMLDVTELSARPGSVVTVLDTPALKVTATRVPHGNMSPSYAYRFDTADGSVVFSGDTSRSDDLIALARDCDLLVHEAADTAWFEQQGLPARLVEHMREVHTDISEVGAIATAAGARHVVVSHLAPADPTQFPQREWASAAHASARAAGYRGRVTVGHDLMRIPLH
ncbi:MBL fold metallo-hydrolase [Streptomyces sp. ISL-96]|uniref:MBL fold metallo-hydrolase n=1 Tax=Streptomyces sp. ISL-96 TaxID=2819191 RepID=UPI001BEB3345|nr:MBL fold metallo-hydrolase [Streptomyces sp. ISL-96]MBT2488627.1 MBL fold metallo-hydrolase [Streptomyces sp. ISL-96]